MNATAGPRRGLAAQRGDGPARLHGGARLARAAARAPRRWRPCSPRRRPGPRGAPARPRSAATRRALRRLHHLEDHLAHAEERLTGRAAGRLALAHAGAGRAPPPAAHPTVRSRAGLITTRWSSASTPFGCGAPAAGGRSEARCGQAVEVERRPGRAPTTPRSRGARPGPPAGSGPCRPRRRPRPRGTPRRSSASGGSATTSSSTVGCASPSPSATWPSSVSRGSA